MHQSGKMTCDFSIFRYNILSDMKLWDGKWFQQVMKEAPGELPSVMHLKINRRVNLCQREQIFIRY